METGEFIREMERLAPPELADEFDEGRIGLIVEGRSRIENVCCALDATPAVVRESARSGADMLVVHHTPIWNPLTAIRGQTASILSEALGSGLNIYVMHTNFDRAPCGVNSTIAAILGLTGEIPMSLGIAGDCTLSLQGISRRLSLSLIHISEPTRPY